MNAAKKTLARAKVFVADHKVAIAVGVTATVTTGLMIAANRSILKDTNAFLAAKGLLEEFEAFQEI